MKINGIEIGGIAMDSRAVKPGDAFFAISGSKIEGDVFAQDAIDKGAAVVVTSLKTDLCGGKIFKVEDPKAFLSHSLMSLYPLKPEKIVAVTGTSGKTSVAYFYYQIAKLLGGKSASIGTLGVISDVEIETEVTLTSPDAITMHKVLSELARQSVEYVACEASSHGIEQKRLDCIKFKGAAFTNFSQDHLDYHQSMDNYFSAKRRLFTELLGDGLGVLNADIEEYRVLKQCKHISYGKMGGEIKLHGYDDATILGRRYKIRHEFGDTFQVYNMLAAVGLGIASGLDVADMVECLQYLKQAPGRLEKVYSINGADIFVDYAHKPDALEKVLAILKNKYKRVVLAFGAGGDRDKGKRLIMGEIASAFADIIIVTDDNPRSEDPSEIRQEIMKGCPEATEIGDRAEAIKYGISVLQPGDCLIIAGKGHEEYQIIKGTVLPFSDKKIAISCAQILGGVVKLF